MTKQISTWAALVAAGLAAAAHSRPGTGRGTYSSAPGCRDAGGGARPGDSGPG